MKPMKLGIIGAGSSYVPELLERLVEIKERLYVDEIRLMDIDEKRLDIMYGFSIRFMKRAGYEIKFTKTTERRAAIEGVDFVLTQLRVGGSDARVNDEKIPLKYGVLGQETTGAGGFTKALRTIPVMLDIARDVEKYNPNAWIVNYTNPTGLIDEAVTKYTKAKIISLCGGGLHPANLLNKAYGIEKNRVKYDFFGLNHLNFCYNITIDGQPLTDEQFNEIAKLCNSVDCELIKKLHLIPSFYLQYYFHKGKKVEGILKSPMTRGETVQEIEKELFAYYADPGQDTKPAALSKRGGGEYAEMALGLIEAIYTNQDKWIVANVPNNGAIRFLPDDAVVEIACVANRGGIWPLALKDIPSEVWGLVAAVKNYEQLTVEAAVHGNRDTALFALLAHPLVGDYDIAKVLLKDLLEVNKKYLPQFFK